jgi:hypothetical protein
LKQLTKSCQATFCAPFKIYQKWALYGECRKNFNDTFSRGTHSNVGFTKFKVQRVINLFEDTVSVPELNYLAEISRSCFSPLWKN